MPKDLIRKRGRKHKKEDKGDAFEPKREPAVPEPAAEAGALAGPSSSPADGTLLRPSGPGVIDPSAPFGYVDPDIKAYFRSVDEKLREWEDMGLAPGEGGESELEGAATGVAVLQRRGTNVWARLVQTERTFSTRAWPSCARSS